jgi:hypothetical protein
MKKNIQTIAFFIIIYLVLAYHDTDVFQGAMKFLFASDKSKVPDDFWLENRMWILGCAITLLVFYFQSAWLNYKVLINSYQNTAIMSVKPPLSAQQANYIYLQNKVSSVSLWLIELCQAGAITLHYEKGVAPWSVSKNEKTSKISEFDRKLLTDLFGSNHHIRIKAIISEPVPEFQNLATQLYEQIKNNNQNFMLKKTGSFLAWLFLSILFIEIPFLNALYPRKISSN